MVDSVSPLRSNQSRCESQRIYGYLLLITLCNHVVTGAPNYTPSNQMMYRTEVAILIFLKIELYTDLFDRAPLAPLDYLVNSGICNLVHRWILCHCMKGAYLAYFLLMERVYFGIASLSFYFLRKVEEEHFHGCLI